MRQITFTGVNNKIATVRFSTRGRVVIPRRLREEFAIEDGARAVVEATSEGILLKPITRVTYRCAEC